ncbi:MAG: ribosome biogenesis GTPase Der [Sphingomonadaceae bacterium]|uniref:ribosome biogenesis GTPase Der n=1 Tax=Thermaurantiacus sp. TaxID=2820283 RepID=UPI00298F3623|nr:ribosome biogenesis GTPase Der [Thermaurantiacus sp.]MCS6986459.1 ribosome biogenesis GTPase Der [Sphingomonadaceae bacterium]MDW8414280.1 ribosome biogenesis GTPase Der [Thermaurantiacus sp.]
MHQAPLTADPPAAAPPPARRPRVVILGRPNVGKSTLFNRLVGRRLALVDDRPGVTRDRREADARLFDLKFVAVDTAGLEEAEAESLQGRMRRQTEAALATADAALFVIDARLGLTEADRHFARWLRQEARVPVVLVANKAEGQAGRPGVLEAFELGLGEPVAVSAAHGEGLADLHAALAPLLPSASPAAEPDQKPLQLAIVGRPNVGKSTLINRLLGEDRLLTGPEAGITRDAIRVPWQFRGRPVHLIDTAGQRRRGRIDDPLEELAVRDAQRAIDFAEVVALLLDSTRGLEAQDLRIAARVLDEGRPLVVVLNKWDVAEERSRLFNGVREALARGLAQVKDVPLLTASGLTGRGLDAVIEAAFAQRERWSRRVPTARLNRWLEAVLARHPPPAPGGRRIRLRYITQARTRPPTFALFGSRLDDLPGSYVRFLINGLSGEFDLAGVPIRLHLRRTANPFERSP